LLLLFADWVKVFVLDYELGTPFKVCVSIFDEVRKGENKSMGSAVFDIGELLGARGNTKAKKMKNGGTIFAQVRKAQGSGLLRLSMKGSKLKNVEGMLSKSDPFFELSRKISSAGGLTWDNVYRSKAIKNNLNPEWEAAVIDLSLLCGGELDAPVQIMVFDFEGDGKHKRMGTAEVSVNGLQSAARTGEPIKLTNSGKDAGTLIVTKAEVSGIEQVTQNFATASISTPSAPVVVVPAAVAGRGTPDFVDYVSGGCELNVVVAIDFTGSNGDPRKPGTLHYIDPNSFNDYEKAVNAIVSILAKYDSDQKFPVVGFGAKYGGVVRHCFQCGDQPEMQGLQGVLKAYESVFQSGLILSSPTNFNEVMEFAAQRAENSMNAAKAKGQQAYTILLIVTDGAVTDPAATAACLNRISESPLSVVIVGVGNANFSSMRFLDDCNRPGNRDIVQFVQFNQHSHNSQSLTSETLREIPDQLTQYFQKKGIAPLPPMQRGDSMMMNIEGAEEEIDLSLSIGEEEIVVTAGGDDFVDGFAASRR
jgi:hypothetical protein